MATRIGHCFERLQSRGRTALVTFVTAGDPSPDATVALMQALVAGGSDIIELGVPFSDPMADGPIIQRASERALAAGQSLKGVLESVAAFRRNDAVTPVVLMGYLNPVERAGAAHFAQAAAASGVDGVLIVDLPPEEAGDLNRELRAAGLDQIFLVAPNSSPSRIERLYECATGFIYYVAVKGVTGDKDLDTAEVGERIREMRERSPVPVGVGFGIKNAATAAAVGKNCDAVVVGSALVEIIENSAGDIGAATRDLGRFVAGLRTALDTASAA